MALFHFRIKSDKKPDGSKISAVMHVNYIRREGTFSDIDRTTSIDHFCGNFISSAEINDACNGIDTLLYHTDDFGSIRNSSSGIELSDNSSPTTISIALLLAHKAMNHQPLIISGSDLFKKSVINAAISDDLPVSFADPLIQNFFIHHKELIENERYSFISNGGTFVTKRHNPKQCSSPLNSKSIETVAQIGLRLPTLSQLPLVHSESQRTDLLLPSDESRQLEQLSKDLYHNVRWDFSDERKKLAERTADKILENINENLAHLSAKSHVEYINRENAFAKRGGCIFQAHHLPKWANDDPKKFFRAADKYEGCGNRRYVEIEFALPNELHSVEQYRQIIDAFIAKHLNDHYYTYAIHEKIGALSNGQRHPHVHIMFSERLIDDVEKIKERSPKNFFKYPARKKKDGSQPSFDEKFKRGSPKSRKWCDHSFITQLRADFAHIQNDILAKNGFSIRVDHRSLKAQKEEAERNGDTFLSKLFDRLPEEYIGIISAQDDNSPHLAQLKEFRALRQQHFDTVLKLDSMAKELTELETKDAVQISSINAKNFIDSKDFSAQSFDSEELKTLRNNLLNAVAEVNKWKRVIISQHDAEEQAKLEYMTKSERQLWLNYSSTVSQIHHLQEFLKNLHQPKESQADALQAYDDIVAGVNKKIIALNATTGLMEKSIANINKKLDSPDFRKNILLVTHHILQGNSFARKKLKQACCNLDRAVDQLRDAIFNKTISNENKEIFKTKEVYDLVRRHFFALKKDYEKTLDLKFDLQQKIISPPRALDMAKNLFLHGNLKALRADLRKYCKDEQRFSKNLSDFCLREKNFLNRDWSVEERPLFLQEKYFIDKQKILLDIEHQRLANLKISLENRANELEHFCQKTESQEKIQDIATGILRKNFKFVRRLEETESRLKLLSQRIKHAKKQMVALKSQLSMDNRHTCYKVVSSDNSSSSESLASIIADAILREPDAVPLVARSVDNDSRFNKDWVWLSEFDKDEIMIKKIVRDL